MRFGPLSLSDAIGAVLAHTVHMSGGALKKGLVLEAQHIDRLRAAGLTEVIAARLDATDIPENEAAALIATAITGQHVQAADAFTGRVNLFAETDGLLRCDRDRLIALNSIDEGLTVATLAPDARVASGRMVATVKIIPFALPRETVEAALAELSGGEPLVSVAAFAPHRTALILTAVPGAKPSVLEKRRVTTARRLADMGSELASTATVLHETGAVTEALRQHARTGADPRLVFGGSAIVDRGDVIPRAIEAAGGRVIHLGMPVDPGNLLLLGELDGRTVIGVPSCASSPKLNGLDWVLERCLAGLETTSADIAAMAPGGLLMEITTRPQPREGAPAAKTAPRIAALILAAGRSSRMGDRHKLLELIDGKPMICHVAEAACSSSAGRVVVVTGAREAEVRSALAGLDVSFVRNPDFADGLSTSLKAGVAALEPEFDGALVLLGDMPLVTPALLDRLITAFNPVEGRAICVPAHAGKRGNPVLWDRQFFAAMAEIRGDTGARHLLGEHEELVCEVPWEDEAIFRDIDTPEALAALRGGHLPTAD